MARYRIIKPEFFSSEQVVECSTTARLLFVGMWCFSDDGGVHPASAARLKMEVFPADPCTAKEVAGWIEELKAAGLVESYVVNSKEFWRVTGWHHQKIEKPTYSYPLSSKFGEESSNRRRGVGDQSTPERKGAEGSVAEWSGRERSASKGEWKANGSAAREEPDGQSPPVAPIGQSPKNAGGFRRQEPAFDLSAVDWGSVVSWAERTASKIPPRTPTDRRMWLRVAVMAYVRFSEAWLLDAVEAVLQAKATRSTKQAHLVAVLKSKAAEDGMSDEMFRAMLRRIEIPGDIWKSGVLEIRK